jgi:4-alpha-glucanotransferase
LNISPGFSGVDVIEIVYDIYAISNSGPPRDAYGKTKFEAGAPPDEFVPKGQGWGNPTYAWSVHQQDGFKWWRRRIAENGGLYDAIRLDHFRGFEAFWAIPTGSKGSTDGYFVRGPGKAFFEAIRESASSAEMFVEDLAPINHKIGM